MPQHDIPQETLAAIQSHFHALIRSRAPWLCDEPRVRFPVLTPPHPTAESKAWFRVPGMYGGFRYWFGRFGRHATLIAESSCRIAEGWAQRHEVTAEGSRLLAQERVWFEPIHGTEHLPPGQRVFRIHSEL